MKEVRRRWGSKTRSRIAWCENLVNLHMQVSAHFLEQVHNCLVFDHPFGSQSATYTTVRTLSGGFPSLRNRLMLQVVSGHSIRTTVPILPFVQPGPSDSIDSWLHPSPARANAVAGVSDFPGTITGDEMRKLIFALPFLALAIAIPPAALADPIVAGPLTFGSGAPFGTYDITFVLPDDIILYVENIAGGDNPTSTPTSRREVLARQQTFVRLATRGACPEGSPGAGFLPRVLWTRSAIRIDHCTRAGGPTPNFRRRWSIPP